MTGLIRIDTEVVMLLSLASVFFDLLIDSPGDNSSVSNSVFIGLLALRLGAKAQVVVFFLLFVAQFVDSQYSNWLFSVN